MPKKVNSKVDKNGDTMLGSLIVEETTNVKVDNVYQPIISMYVKTDGIYKQLSSMFAKINNEWVNIIQ